MASRMDCLEGAPFYPFVQFMVLRLQRHTKDMAVGERMGEVLGRSQEEAVMAGFSTVDFQNLGKHFRPVKVT